MDFKTLQEEQLGWVEYNFPGRDWTQPFMGVVEEVGELSHALLKQRQGIRGTHADHEAAAQDAVGDIVVFLADLCSARGWDFQDIVDTVWAEVSQRDWRQDGTGCKTCGGQGVISDGSGNVCDLHDCPACHGSGKAESEEMK